MKKEEVSLPNAVTIATRFPDPIKEFFLMAHYAYARTGWLAFNLMYKATVSQQKVCGVEVRVHRLDVDYPRYLSKVDFMATAVFREQDDELLGLVLSYEDQGEFVDKPCDEHPDSDEDCDNCVRDNKCTAVFWSPRSNEGELWSRARSILREVAGADEEHWSEEVSLDEFLEQT